METFRILAINPGSTSTKIAVFDNEKSIFLKNIKHSNEDLAPFNSISEQYEFRKEVILNELIQADIDIERIDAVVGRGGLVKPIESGVYEVNESLKRDLRVGILGEHASNLGGLIADDIAKSLPEARAFIADPVVVDELDEVARITGCPSMPRQSVFHALNQKAVARLFARTRGFVYEELNLIVAHMGGGISIGAHRQGRVVDVNNALDGYGPFSPERAGTLPTGALIRACYSGKYSYDEMKKIVNGKGGLVAHLGTNQAYEVEKRVKAGDKHAELVLSGMCYQIGKAIGGCATVLKGKVNGIILTGGIAHDKFVVDYIKEMVDFIAPVAVYPGEDEMTALMQNALMAMRNQVKCKIYQ
ncbi:butyrate kinase [Labilibacter sediminis]|nr:butyrate kinase [Labilibacter sediminis]